MLTGGCVCGGVRFEVSEAPKGAAWCHCTRCRRRTGVHASMSVHVPDGSFRVVQGEELITRFTPEGGFTKAFCSFCGGHLFSEAAPGRSVGVRLGAFDADPGVRPDRHQHVASAATWILPLPDDGLPRHEGATPS